MPKLGEYTYGLHHETLRLHCRRVRKTHRQCCTCMHLSVEVISILQHLVTSQYLALAQWDTDKELCCFCSNPVELTAANRAWPITDTDSVLSTLEDRAILQSLWHTATVPTWHFRLQVLLWKRYLLTITKRTRVITRYVNMSSASDSVIPRVRLAK